jgi:hypothetical protein
MGYVYSVKLVFAVSVAEYLELLTSSADSAALHAMNFVAVFSAFVVATYIVGGRLTRIQAWALSVTYSVFAALPLLTAVEMVGRNFLLKAEFFTQYPDIAPKYVSDFSAEPSVAGTIMAIAWLISIIYMVSERRNFASA